jgi:diacylglycerol O-acyltransferase / wax synthase
LRLIPLRGRPSHYERLSPQDASFLAFEKPNIHMNVGAVTIFESGSFRGDDGRIDVPKFRQYIASRITGVERCYQKLAKTTLLRRPMWVDDPDFSIERHVKSAGVANIDDEDEMRRLSSTIFSRPLDRSRPLWELTVVQGQRGASTFGVICKVHHGMLDGMAGMDFIGSLLGVEPHANVDEVAPFHAAPPPARWRVAADDAALIASTPWRLGAGLARLASKPATRASFRERTLAVVHLFASGLRGTTQTPLSAPPNAQRFHRWATTSKADERVVRARLGGSRDDVTIAVASGATRAALQRKQVRTKGIRIRAMAPMSIRSRAERGTLGNRVSMLIVDIPVDEASPVRRLERVSAAVARLRRIKQGLGVDVLAAIDEFTGTLAQRFAMWLATQRRTYNIVVTNIPGPPVPLYALESKLLALYPLAPVFGGQQINVAAVSYLDTVFWGVQYAGDDDDELRRFVDDIVTSADELLAAAREAAPRIRVMEPEDVPAADIIAAGS